MFRLRALLFGKNRPDPVEALRRRVEKLRDLVERNNRVLELMADAEEKLSGEYIFDKQYLRWLDAELAGAVHAAVQDLSQITREHHKALEETFQRIRNRIDAILEAGKPAPPVPLCMQLEGLGSEEAAHAGEKMARLGELRSRLNVPVPPGFVVTASAFAGVTGHPALAPLVDAIDSTDTDPVAVCAELQDRLKDIPLPKNVISAIKSSLKSFGRKDRFAVRSSAIGEDGRLSFAGVYDTVMNVPRNSVIDACREVIASLFSERAVLYRQSHGSPMKGAAMAVGCMRMVRAAASGVLYTLDPADPSSDAMLISASWGFGATVVEGTGTADRFLVDRRPPHRILNAVIAEKIDQFQADAVAGLRRMPVEDGRRSEPSISDTRLRLLAATALAVERYMHAPQDIEWAIDEQGALWILQARPLLLDTSPTAHPDELAAAVAGHAVLMQGAGVVACRGIAAGRVVVLDSSGNRENIPSGSVLVTQSASPTLAHLLPSAAALIAESGSSAGHLAALAREYHVPALMAAGAVSRILEPGREVTVDTEENVVYAGRVDALIRHGLLQGDRYEDTREFRMLRRMLKFVTPLHLLDPASPRFSPEQSSSYHDIIRFAHEKAVVALSNLSNLNWRHARRWLRRVSLDIPLGLSLIDLGGGVAAKTPPGDIGPAHITCTPLAILLEALTAPGVWGTLPTNMDLTAFMSSVTRSNDLADPGTMAVRRNLAIVSGNHMNLSLYLGYHFNIIDCYVGDSPEDSYMFFRFAGGASEMTRRSRRADLLDRILSRYGFAVERTGDLVLARLHGVSPPGMKLRLQMTGRLIGFTRQLDILLRNEDITRRMVDAFMAGSSDPMAVLQEEEKGARP
jgi:pyruvate,water dikinase